MSSDELSDDERATIEPESDEETSRPPTPVSVSKPEKAKEKAPSKKKPPVYAPKKEPKKIEEQAPAPVPSKRSSAEEGGSDTKKQKKKQNSSPAKATSTATTNAASIDDIFQVVGETKEKVGTGEMKFTVLETQPPPILPSPGYVFIGGPNPGIFARIGTGGGGVIVERLQYDKGTGGRLQIDEAGRAKVKENKWNQLTFSINEAVKLVAVVSYILKQQNVTRAAIVDCINKYIDAQNKE